jgi:diadenosine tetraphosphate (Ap4A) HIT family hydrolase
MRSDARGKTLPLAGKSPTGEGVRRSGDSHMLKTTECCLCSQLAGEESNDLIARMLEGEPYVRRVMLESESFAAIPSLGPLASGHSLLCPKMHVRSFAQLEHRLHDEYQVIKNDLRRALSYRYASPIHLFEHGMAVTGDRIVCTTDHAHMHFVPLPRSCKVDGIEQSPWVEFDGSLKQLTELSQGGEYILYEPPDGICRLLNAGERSFDSQHMRKLLSRAIGRSENWNWRDNPDPRSADQTWRRFASWNNCFVTMPYGKNKDVDGNEIDFDEIDECIIEAAIKKLEECEGGPQAHVPGMNPSDVLRMF